MNNNQPTIAKIKNLLNHSTDTLGNAVLIKLATNRQHVLLQAAKANHLKAEASGLTTLRLRAISFRHDFRFWFGIIIIIACCFAANQDWQHFNEDHSEIDIAILTDELPIDVYVD